MFIRRKKSSFALFLREVLSSFACRASDLADYLQIKHSQLSNVLNGWVAAPTVSMLMKMDALAKKKGLPPYDRQKGLVLAFKARLSPSQIILLVYATQLKSYKPYSYILTLLHDINHVMRNKGTAQTRPFHHCLKECLTYFGGSQRQFALSIELSEKYLSDILSERDKPPSPDVLFRMEAVLRKKRVPKHLRQELLILSVFDNCN